MSRERWTLKSSFPSNELSVRSEHWFNGKSSCEGPVRHHDEGPEEEPEGLAVGLEVGQKEDLEKGPETEVQVKWFGLTGGIASGKSSVSQILKDEGFAVVDADAIAREVVEAGSPGLAAVVAQFGTAVVRPDGSLDRKKLGQLVFGNPEKLLQLENILHPLVKQETWKQRQGHQSQGREFVFYDVPLLFEKNMQSEFDGIIVVTASDELLRQRMKKRDQLSDEEITNRLKAQLPLSEKMKKATWVIDNHGTLEDLRRAVLKVFQEIQSGKA